MLEKHPDRSPPEAKVDRLAMVLLLSRGLASWLEDDEFVSELVRPLLSEERQEQRQASLLAAVVDGIPRQNMFDPKVEGISVFVESQNFLLPRVWESDTHAADASPGLTFQAPSLFSDSNASPGTSVSRVTLPLANTIFENGQPWTMVASRWERESSDQKSPGKVMKRDHCRKAVQQVFPEVPIAGQRSAKAASNLALPLVPITRRQMVHGAMGNILSSVNGQGPKKAEKNFTKPASTDLEALVPTLLEVRRKYLPAQEGEPMGVWALITPSSECQEVPHAEPVDFTSSRSWRAFRYPQIYKILRDSLANGCHLHKICESPPSVP
jgi:hypothetical protein